MDRNSENNASYLVSDTESECENFIRDSFVINESASSDNVNVNFHGYGVTRNNDANPTLTNILSRTLEIPVIPESENEEEYSQLISDDENSDLISKDEDPVDLTPTASESSFNEDDGRTDNDNRMDISIEKSMSDMSLLEDLPNDDKFILEQHQGFLKYKLLSVDREIDKLEKLADTSLSYLPDGGKKIIEDLQEQLELKKNLSKQLNIIPKNEIKIEKEEKFDNFYPNNLKKEENFDNSYPDNLDRKVVIKKEERLDNFYPDNVAMSEDEQDDEKKELGATAQGYEYPKASVLTIQTLENMHQTLVTMPKENDFADTPSGLRLELKDHQKHALAWMMWRENQKPCGGVLADDMGLGKTLTTIALILKGLEQVTDLDSDDDDDWRSTFRSKLNGQTLIVCPASLLSHWEKEVKDKCKRGTLSVEVYHGPNRLTDPRKLRYKNIVLTTYHTLSRDNTHYDSVLYKMNWNRIILDEAHIIRNYRSGLSKAACALSVKKTWALTGTPIQNKEFDLYPILKFLKCSPFDELAVWKRIDNKNVAGHKKLATIMKSIMLRRTKEELKNKGELKGLPEKNVETIEIVLDHEEDQVYQKVLTFSQSLFAQFLAQKAAKQQGNDFVIWGGKNDRPSIKKNPDMEKAYNEARRLLASSDNDKVEAYVILVLLLRLRQLCCHPALIHAMLDAEDMETNGGDLENVDTNLLQSVNSMSIHDMSLTEEDKENQTNNLLTSANPVFHPKRLSSKMRAVIAKIEEIMEKNNKLIVVSQWVSLLNIVASQLESIPGAKYEFFTGKTLIPKRQDIIDKFNNPDHKLKILLLSLTAGGVGLNLIGGNNMLIIDLHWNPALETQVQDRIYRLGQTKDVCIYKFICRDTIEERILQMQESKLQIAENVLTNQKVMTGNKLTLNDLKNLFGM